MRIINSIGILTFFVIMFAVFNILIGDNTNYENLSENEEKVVNRIECSFLSDLNGSKYQPIFIKNIDELGVKKTNNYFSSEAFFNYGKGDPYIVLKPNRLGDSDYNDIVKHEYFHYIDYLLGDKQKNTPYSTEVRFSEKVIDTKLLKLDTKEKFSELNSRLTILLKGDGRIKLTHRYLEYIDYLTGDSETFARLMMFKIFLKNNGVISSIDETPNIKKLNEFIKTYDWTSKIREESNSSLVDLILLVKRDSYGNIIIK